MSPFDKRMHYKNIHLLVFGLWRLSTNLSNTPIPSLVLINHIIINTLTNDIPSLVLMICMTNYIPSICAEKLIAWLNIFV